MRNRKRQTLSCLSAVTLAALLLGCGNGTQKAASSESTEPTLSHVQVITNQDQIHLPLDSYDLTRDQHVALDEAQYLLTAACMKSYNVPFTEPRQDPSTYDAVNRECSTDAGFDE